MRQIERKIQDKIKKEIDIIVPVSKLWKVAVKLGICPRCGSKKISYDDYGQHYHCLSCERANRDFIF